MVEGRDKLGDFEVTPEYLAADYHDGQAVHDEYTAWLDFFAAGKNVRPAEYAGLLGYTKEAHLSDYNGACSRFSRWKRQDHSKPIAGCLRAHRLGIFPMDGEECDQEEEAFFDPRELSSFTPEHKYFRLACLLASMIYSTGTLIDNKGSERGTSKTSNIACRELGDDTFLGMVIDFLNDIDWTKTPRDNNAQGYKKKDGALNAVVSRVLAFLGFTPGRKQGLGDALPNIFGRALNTLEDEEADFRELAEDVLIDFVLTFIITRAFMFTRPRRLDRHIGFLVSRHTREIADQQAEVFMKIIKIAGLEHLGCELVPRDLRVGNKQAPVSSYTHTVHFRNMDEEMLKELKAQMNQRVEKLLKEAGA